MKLKTRKTLIAGAATMLVTGTALGVGLPFVLTTTQTPLSFVKKNMHASDMDALVLKLTGPRSKKAKEAVKAFAEYVFDNNKRHFLEQKSKEEDGIIKATILVNGQGSKPVNPQAGSTFTLNSKDNTWATNLVKSSNATFGIYVEVINEKIYTIKVIDPNKLAGKTPLINLNEGHAELFRFIGELKEADYIKRIIGNDGTKSPSEMNVDKLFEVASFKNHNKLTPELVALIAKLKQSEDIDITLLDIPKNSKTTTANVLIRFLNKEFNLSFNQFRPNNQKSPVDIAYNALHGTKQAKKDTLKDTTGPYNIAWINNVLGLNLTSNEVDYVIENAHWNGYTFIGDIKITSKTDPLDTKTAKIKIEGFVNQADIDIKDDITEVVINNFMKTKIGTPLNTKRGSEELKKIFTDKNNTEGIIDITSPNNHKYSVRLALYEKPDDTRGSFSYKYSVIADSKKTGYANANITTNLLDKYGYLSGFKKFETQKQIAERAQAYFNLFHHEITVPNQKKTPVESVRTNQNALNAMIDAFKADIANQNIPGTPKISITQIDRDNGKITATVKYSFGNYDTSTTVIFNGFATTDSINEGKLQEDVDNVKRIIAESIQTSKTKQNFPTHKAWTIDNINDLLNTKDKIPAAINGVNRTFVVTSDRDTGTLKVKINFSLANKADNFEFNITNFRTNSDDVQELIDNDFNKLNKTVNAKANLINTFAKGNTLKNIDKINALLNTNDQLVPSSGMDWNIKVTSPTNATTLVFEITVSGTRSTTPKKATLKINNLQSQADFDSANLGAKVIEKLGQTMWAIGTNGGTANENKHRMPKAPIGVVVGDTIFRVTFKQDGTDTVAIDNYKGTIKFKYTATAVGLNKTIVDISATLSGFKTTLTDAEKKAEVQSELDKLAANPINSQKPNTKPGAYTGDDAKALLTPLISDHGTKDIAYVIKSTGDGEVVATLTYTFGTEVATKDITINGLMSNKAIASEEIALIKNAVQIGNQVIIIDNKDGIDELKTAQTLSKTDATKFGITLPIDLNGVDVKWTHTQLKKDGELTITLEFSKSTGKKLTKVVKVNVEGIDKGILEDRINKATVDLVKNLPELATGDPTKLASNRAKPAETTLKSFVRYKITQWKVDDKTGEIKYKVTFSGAKTQLTKESKEVTITGFGKVIDVPKQEELGNGIGSRDGWNFTVSNLSKLHPDWHIKLIQPMTLTKQGQDNGVVMFNLQKGYLFMSKGIGKDNTYIPIHIDHTLYNNFIKAENAKKYLDNLAKGIIDVPNQKDNFPNTIGGQDADAPKFIRAAYNAQTNADKHSAGNPTFTIVSTNQENGTASIKIEYKFGVETTSRVIKFGGFKTKDEDEQAKLAADKKAVIDKLTANGTINNNVLEVKHPQKRELPYTLPANLDTINQALPTAAKLPDAINQVTRKYVTKFNKDKGEIDVTITFAYHQKTETYTFKITGFKTTTELEQEKIDAAIVLLNKNKTITAKNDAVNTFKKGDTPSITDINALLPTTNAINVNNALTTKIKVTSDEHATDLKLEFTISSTVGGTPKIAIITINQMLSQADLDSNNLNDAVIAKLKAIMDVKGPSGKTANENKDKMPSSPVDVTVGKTTFSVTFKQDGVDAVAINNYKGIIKFKYTAIATGLNKTIKDVSEDISGFKTTLTDAEKKAEVQSELDKLAANPINSQKPDTKPGAYTGDDAKALLASSISDHGTKDIAYVIKSTGDGEVVATLTYTFGTEVATKDITINGLMSNKAIASEEIALIKNAVQIGNQVIIIDNKDGIDELKTAQTLSKTDATKFGITLPIDLNGVDVKWTHTQLKKDGELTITLEFNKSIGTKLTKVVKVNVEGINKAILEDRINKATIALVKNLPELATGDPTKLASNRAKPAEATLKSFVHYKITQWKVDDKTGEIKYTVTFSGAKTQLTKESKEVTITGFGKVPEVPSAKDLGTAIAKKDGTTYALSNINSKFQIDHVDYNTIKAGATTGSVNVHLKSGYLFKSGKSELTITGIEIDQILYENVVKANNAKTYLETLGKTITNVPNQRSNLPSTIGKIGADASQAIIDAYNALTNSGKPVGGNPTFKIISTNKTEGTASIKIEYTFGQETISHTIEFGGFKTQGDVDREKLAADKKAVIDKLTANGTINNNVLEVKHPQKRELPYTLPANLDTINQALPTAAKLPDAINQVTRKYVTKFNKDKGEIDVTITFAYHQKTETYTFKITGFKTTTELEQEKIDAAIVLLNKNKTITAKNDAVNTFKKGDTPSITDINALLPTTNAINVNNALTTKIKVTSDEHATDLKLEFTISSTVGGTPKTTIITINKLLSQADLDSNNLNDAVIAKLKAIMDVKGPSGKTANENKDKMPSSPVDVTVGKTTFSVTFKQDGVDAVAINNYKGIIKFKYTAIATGLNKTIKDVSEDISGFKTTLTDAEKKAEVQSELDKLAANPINSQKPDTKPGAYTGDDAKALLASSISDHGTKDITYVIKSTGDGEVVATLTYTFGTEVATKDITINGLMSNKAIASEEIALIKNAVQIGNQVIIIDNKDGIDELKTAQTLSKTDATKFGITLPIDLNGVDVKWTHTQLKKDGELTITLEFSKSTGKKLTKVVKVNVEGINKAILEDRINKATIALVKNLPELATGDPTKLASNRAKPAEATLKSFVHYKITQWKVDDKTGEIKYTVTFSGAKTQLTKESKEVTITGFGKVPEVPSAKDLGTAIAKKDGTTYALSNINSKFQIDHVDYNTIKAGATTGSVNVHLKSGYLFKSGKSELTITGIEIDQILYENVVKANNAKTYLETLGKTITNVPNQRSNLPSTIGKIGADASQAIIDAYNALTNSGKPVGGNPTFKIISTNKTEGTASIKIEYTFGQETISHTIEFGGFKTQGDVDREKLAADKKAVIDKLTANGTINNNVLEVKHPQKRELPYTLPANLDTINQALPTAAKLPDAINQVTRKYVTKFNKDKGEIDVTITFAYHQKTETYTFKITGFKTTTELEQEKIDAVIANLDKNKTINAKNDAVNTFKKGDTPSIADINALLRTTNAINVNNAITTKIKVTSDEHATVLKLEFTISSTIGGTPKTTIITINKLLSQADLDSNNLNDAVIAKLKAIMEVKGDKGNTVEQNKDKFPSNAVDITVGKTTFSVTFTQDGANAVDNPKGTIKFKYTATATGLHVPIANHQEILSGFRTTFTDLEKKTKLQSQLDILAANSLDSGKPQTKPSDYTVENAKALISTKITNHGADSLDVTIINEESGGVHVKLEYHFGNEVASTSILINGLMTYEQIANNALASVYNATSHGNKTIIINDKDGLDEIKTAEQFTKSIATQFGITLPADLDGVDIKWKRTKLKVDGELTITLEFSRQYGKTLTKEFKVNVEGINKAILEDHINKATVALVKNLPELATGDPTKLASNRAKPAEATLKSFVHYKITQWKADDKTGEIKYTVTFSGAKTQLTKESKEVTITGFGKVIEIPTAQDLGIATAKKDGTTYNFSNINSKFQIDHVDYNTIKAGATTGSVIIHLKSGYLFKSGKSELTITGIEIDQILYENVVKANNAKTYLETLGKTITNVPNQRSNLPSTIGKIGADASQAIIDAYNALTNSGKPVGGNPTFKIISTNKTEGTASIKIEYTFGQETISHTIDFGGFKTQGDVDREKLAADKKAVIDKLTANGTINNNVLEVKHPQKRELPYTLPANLDTINQALPTAAKLPDAINQVTRKYVTKFNKDKGEIDVTITFAYHQKTETYTFKITGFKTTTELEQEKIDAVIANLAKNKTINAKNDAVNTFKKGDTPSIADINALLPTTNAINVNNAITTKIKVTSDEHATVLKLEFTISSTIGGTPKTTIITINKLLSQADLDSNNLNDAVIAKLKAIMEVKGDKGNRVEQNKDKFPSNAVDITVGKTTFSVTFKQDGADAIDSSKGTIKFKYTATATGLHVPIANHQETLSGFRITFNDLEKKTKLQSKLDILAANSLDSGKPQTKPSDYTVENAKALISTKITNHGADSLDVTIINEESGGVHVKFEYHFGNEVASTSILINGLMTYEQIANNALTSVYNATSHGNKTITINDKDGLDEIKTAEQFTKSIATQFGITLPADLDGVDIKWKRTKLKVDGELTITLEFSRQYGKTLTKEFKVNVEGINKAILEDKIQKSTGDIVPAFSKSKWGKLDELASKRQKPTGGQLSNGVKWAVTKWQPDDKNGNINYTITFSGDGTNVTHSDDGILPNFGKVLAKPATSVFGTLDANVDGTTWGLSKQKMNSISTKYHIENVIPQKISVGATTGTLEIHLYKGFLFADGTSLLKLSGIKINQAAYHAWLLKKTKAEMIKEMTDAVSPIKLDVRNHDEDVFNAMIDSFEGHKKWVNEQTDPAQLKVDFQWDRLKALIQKYNDSTGLDHYISTSSAPTITVAKDQDGWEVEKKDISFPKVKNIKYTVEEIKVDEDSGGSTIIVKVKVSSDKTSVTKLHTVTISGFKINSAWLLKKTKAEMIKEMTDAVSPIKLDVRNHDEDVFNAMIDSFEGHKRWVNKQTDPAQLKVDFQWDRLKALIQKYNDSTGLDHYISTSSAPTITVAKDQDGGEVEKEDLHFPKVKNIKYTVEEIKVDVKSRGTAIIVKVKVSSDKTSVTKLHTVTISGFKTNWPRLLKKTKAEMIKEINDAVAKVHLDVRKHDYVTWDGIDYWQEYYIQWVNRQTDPYKLKADFDYPKLKQWIKDYYESKGLDYFIKTWEIHFVTVDKNLNGWGVEKKDIIFGGKATIRRCFMKYTVEKIEVDEASGGSTITVTYKVWSNDSPVTKHITKTFTGLRAIGTYSKTIIQTLKDRTSDSIVNIHVKNSFNRALSKYKGVKKSDFVGSKKAEVKKTMANWVVNYVADWNKEIKNLNSKQKEELKKYMTPLLGFDLSPHFNNYRDRTAVGLKYTFSGWWTISFDSLSAGGRVGIPTNVKFISPFDNDTETNTTPPADIYGRNR